MFRPPLAGRVTPPAPFPEYMTAALWFSRISLWVYFYRRVLQRTQSRAISSEIARICERLPPLAGLSGPLGLRFGIISQGGRIRNFSHLQLCSWKYLQIII